MQDNNRYLNLIRTTELAKRKGEPYIPFDVFEMDLFTKFTALDHLPQLKNSEVPEGWKLHTSINSNDYQALVDNIKVYTKDLSKNTFGIMVDSNKKALLVFVKQSF